MAKKREDKVRIRLLEVLAEERMKMTELARKTGIAYSTINNFANEKAERIDLKTLFRICNGVGRQPGDILYIPE